MAALPAASAWLASGARGAAWPRAAPRALSASSLEGGEAPSFLDLLEGELAALGEDELASHVRALAADAAGEAADGEAMMNSDGDGFDGAVEWADEDELSPEEERADTFFALIHSGRGRGGALRDASAVRDAVGALAPRKQKEFVVAIGALGRAGDAGGALALLDEMTGDVLLAPPDDLVDADDTATRVFGDSAPTPNALCYAAAINAINAGEQRQRAAGGGGGADDGAPPAWARALELLVEMEARGVAPDAACYEGSLVALAADAQVERSLVGARRRGTQRQRRRVRAKRTT